MRARKISKAQHRAARLADRKDQLYGLMRGYGINPQVSSCWFRLCVVLAAKLEAKEAAPRKKGAPVKWDSKAKIELVCAVDRYRGHIGRRLTAKSAIALLKKKDRGGRWKDYTAGELAARYSEFEPQCRGNKIVKRVLRELATENAA